MSAIVVRKLLFEVGKHCAEAIASGVPRELALETAAEGLRYSHAEPLAAIAPAIALAWAQSGFPTIEPGHRLAASLMATNVPHEHVTEFVRMPWRCFGFQIPGGLFTQDDGFALALNSRDGLFRLLSYREGALHIGIEPSLADWSLKNLTAKPNSDFTPEESDRKLRLMELTGRLFLGICVEMSEHRPSEESSTAGHKQRAAKSDVSPSVFKLTRNVKVDVRAAVRDYVDGKRPATPTVQTLVRGHWKMQAHGTGSTDRKLIHVEPYWRGEETAPVAVRSHVL